MKRKVAADLMPSVMPWFWMSMSFIVGNSAWLSSPKKSSRYWNFVSSPTCHTGICTKSPWMNCIAIQGSPFLSTIFACCGMTGYSSVTRPKRSNTGAIITPLLQSRMVEVR